MPVQIKSINLKLKIKQNITQYEIISVYVLNYIECVRYGKIKDPLKVTCLTFITHETSLNNSNLLRNNE